MARSGFAMSSITLRPLSLLGLGRLRLPWCIHGLQWHLRQKVLEIFQWGQYRLQSLWILYRLLLDPLRVQFALNDWSHLGKAGSRVIVISGVVAEPFQMTTKHERIPSNCPQDPQQKAKRVSHLCERRRK